MKKIFLPIVLMTCLCSLSFASNVKDHLKSGFVAPNDSITTSVYWYWISGNISKDGVIKDLESMKKAGINRAFIGNIQLNPGEAPQGKVKLFSDEWYDIVHAALKRAGELGIDIGMFNCPGWSQVGGPWTTPNHSMRYLASTQTRIEGGKRVEIILERPQGAAAAEIQGNDAIKKNLGKYKDYFQDVRVIAFPSITDIIPKLTSQNATISANPEIADVQSLLITDNTKEIIFSKDAETFDISTKKDFDLRSITICTAYRGTQATGDIQVKEGSVYRSITHFKLDRTNSALNVGFIPYAPAVITVPKTTGREFRLVLTGLSGGFRKIELSSLPKVENYAEKTLAKMCPSPFPYWHEYQWREQARLDNDALAVDPSKIIDVSQYLSGDKFMWDAPAGNWTIMRCGMLPTLTDNGPAATEGTGLEIDKMTSAYLQQHFDSFLGKIIKRIPASDRKSLKISVNDSYEVGGQNFTDTFISDFKKIYAYDPVPYLPVFSGVVVKSQDVSDRFLWDVRRMVADKLAYEHVGGMRKIANAHGLKTWLECYGHWGFDGEFLQYGGQSDEIGGEFWTAGALGNIENRAASSCAHIYGKNRVSAESFTAGGSNYDQYPASIKSRGDRFFAEGINNTLLHVFISQASDTIVPGLNAPFSTEFNRKNTWFSQIDLFTSYLKRSNYMLQQGLNVADIAYFIGEDAPKMTGSVDGEGNPDPRVPKGYQFDFINGEVILKNLSVKNGILTLPHGTQYRILVLPKLATMRPKLLAKIKQLVMDGAVVLGHAPTHSPSLENYPQSDQEIKKLASELWGDVDGIHKKYAKVGKGLIIDGMDMTEAMSLINEIPDCQVGDNNPVLFAHRTMGKAEIYFISNQSDKEIVFSPEFRVKELQPELWDPTSGQSRILPAFTANKMTTAVPLKLEANQSIFVVFRRPANKVSLAGIEANYPIPQAIVTLTSNWVAKFDASRWGPKNPERMNQLIDLSKSTNDSIKYYSGTIHYSNTFQLTSVSSNLYLDLGEVVAMAKVKINGKYVGGVWTAPYRLNISKYAVKGTNRVEIEVVNTWVNRLIGDKNLPKEQQKTWIPNNTYNAHSNLQKAGLLGPVVVESIK